MNQTSAKNNTTLAYKQDVKKIAVIQLSRIGDVLQTCQSHINLKKTHGDVFLVLIARKKFARPIQFILEQYFDKIIYLDFPEYLTNSKNLNELKREFKKTLDEINSLKIDLVINLTFSRTSSFLSGLIVTSQRSGPYFKTNMELSINDQWSQYLYANVTGNKLNPFSLIDIYKQIIGNNKEFAAPSILPATSKNNLIVVHPFASHERKYWKPEKWREIIYKTLKDNDGVTIAIVGAKNEMKLADKLLDGPLIGKYLNRIENHVGKATLEEVYYKLCNAKLFIGHDSSIGHLAKFAKCKTLTISLGTVRPLETTPFGPESYCIVPSTKCFPCNPNEACSLFKCHLDIPYQTVNGLINILISGQTIDEKIFENKIPAFLLSASKIYSFSFNQSGFSQLNEIFSNNKNETEVFKLIYRILWQYSFSQIEEESKFPTISKTTFDNLYIILKGLEHVYQLCHFGKKFCQYILEEVASKNPNLSNIKSYSDKIDEMNNLMDIIKANYPLLTPIIDFHKVSMSNTPGQNLVEITESTYLSFTNLENYSSVIYELIEKILIESKHKSLEPRHIKSQGEV